MIQISNPIWWGPEHDFAWDHVKLSLQSAVRGAADTNEELFHCYPGQQIFPEFEPACRFGYGARLEYGLEHSEWNPELEKQLLEDWRVIAPERVELWEQDRAAMCYGWNFAASDLEPVSGQGII